MCKRGFRGKLGRGAKVRGLKEDTPLEGTFERGAKVSGVVPLEVRSQGVEENTPLEIFWGWGLKSGGQGKHPPWRTLEAWSGGEVLSRRVLFNIFTLGF